MVKFMSLDITGSITTMQVDVKPVLSMLQMDRDLCGGRDMLVVLLSDSTVHVVDLHRREVVYVMKPQVVSCDSARSMCFNFSKTHLMTCTNGGYVIIWKM